MSAISGMLSVSNAQTDDLVGEWQETVLVRNAKGYNTGSTLFGLMARLKNEPAENTEFSWWEREPSRLVFYSSSASGTGTTINVDDGSGNDVYHLLYKNAVLRHDTSGEYIRVTADPSSAAITVAREGGAGGFSGSAVSIADNDTFTLITAAKDEGADAVRAAFEEPSDYNNYIQTYNESVEVSNAFKGSVLRTDIEGPLRERRVQSLERIANKIELSYFFGRKARMTGTNGYVYYTGGIVDGIDTAGLTDNALDANGSTGVTLSALQEWLQSFMVNGSDAKLAFCGPKAYAAFSNFANSATAGFRVMNTESIFGMNITEILTPFGTLNLAFHPQFKVATNYNDWAVVVDLALLNQKVFEPLFLETNIQSNGQDAYKEQYRAKLGLKLKFPAAFGYVENLEKIIAG